MLVLKESYINKERSYLLLIFLRLSVRYKFIKMDLIDFISIIFYDKLDLDSIIYYIDTFNNIPDGQQVKYLMCHQDR
jgi:hypothetical protein